MSQRIKVCALFALALSLLFYNLAKADEADLVWSTFLGGSGDEEGRDIAVTASGRVYVIGGTWSPGFPSTAGAFDTTYHGGQDAFVAVLDEMGSSLYFSTFLGGSDSEGGWGIAVDDSGNAYVAGNTRSEDFPATAGAFDTSYNGVGGWDIGDAFVAKLNQTGGSLVYATFLGGGGDDLGYAITLDNSGNAHVTGYTGSADFPTTAGAFDTTLGVWDAFVAVLSPTGSAVNYATFLGGSDWEYAIGMALDDAGNVYLTGGTESSDFPVTPGAFDTTLNGAQDCFVAKLVAGGAALEYATYLGGASWDINTGRCAVDELGNVYLTGWTESSDFPVTAGAFDITPNGLRDVFIAKLNAAGNALDYSTYLGESDTDEGWGIAVDSSGNAYVTGYTGSADFPTTPEAFDTTYNGAGDAFVAKLNAAGNTLYYSTFMGGSYADGGNEIKLGSFNYVYLTGWTNSLNFPITPGAFDTLPHPLEDVFVAKLDLSGYPVPVALASFEAAAGQGFIALNWVTASEINCHRWEIYRGRQEDGLYTEIGELPGHGSTETPHSYRWVDRQVVTGTTYFYKLRQMDLDGSWWWSHSVSASSVLPKHYALSQNYPNPFNTNTQIRYQIPRDEHVSLKIFNLLGQEVRTLVDADQEASWHMVNWDGRDDRDQEVATGLYFCRLEAGDVCKTTKMMLIK
jgi:hypothetical protein